VDGNTKSDWRRQMRATRKIFVASQPPVLLEKLWIKLATVAMPHVAPFKTICSYHAVGNEINPALIERALQKNATIALPRVTAPAEPLTLHAVTASTEFETGYGNIPCPPQSAPVVRPDILLVPLVGVDRQGVRLGQGQGHYDATIAALRAHGRVFVLGLAYDCQLVNELPAEPHDQRLDALATPTRFLTF
jgi:5-formyltetrahydrofolate cyclo-ligase